MNRILPYRDGKSAHITSGYFVTRPVGSSPHRGIDFNYVGGQRGINLTNPPIYAPISGIVVKTGGAYGVIAIRDGDGLVHKLLHTNSQLVQEGQSVEAGTLVGTMGDTGAPKSNHVHYEIVRGNQTIDPAEYWNYRDTNINKGLPSDYGLRGTDAPDWVLRDSLPPDCFLSNTDILMADSTIKNIQNIKIGDVVSSFKYDNKEKKYAEHRASVSKIFVNITRRVVDLRGLHCTPGHVFLTGDTDADGHGRFDTIASILRHDGTLVEQDATVIRARTGARLGQAEDALVSVVYTDTPKAGRPGPERRVLVRAGIPLPPVMIAGKAAPAKSLAQHLVDNSITLLADGRLRTPDGAVHDACNWPEGDTPFDSHEARNWIVQDDGRPYCPPWIRDLVPEDETVGLRVVGALSA
jgi:Peptidase family M23